MPTIKEQIKNIQYSIEILEHRRLELAGWSVLCDPYFSVVGDWDCPKSPSGLCCYNHYIDVVHDECVFCGQPEERK